MGIGQLFKSMLDSGKVDIERRYEILRAAVSGTMSDFHMARDRKSGQIVGLKILDKKKTEQLEARFKGLSKPSEGEISMQMIHPRIVVTHSFGMTTKGEQFIVMEFLDGPGLNSCIIGRNPILDGNRLALMTQAAEALDAVHQAGYIHRDVCPRNFVCAKDGKSLKLIDFGLTVPATPPFQQPGNRTGTPNYMAPEVVRRRATDQRLDIFAFGASMYEMFAFELPWVRGSDGLAAMSHGASEPPPLSQYYPKIRPELEAIIMKCIQAEPADRHASMDSVLQQLRRIKSEDVD
ncbi:Serine/threonine-protein kinase PknB [Posidoniimonas polymericola]|uniref:Serine/threonine-protein kinase PknB n=1 Tax=Posidoniimonas polymericola TaxID=2528002 RepID=A0A5C5ZDE3_9BACT|nr:serine/threonine-protein kinase [Posidoniimonas polymericola]TWT85439.1 Serine/threonine-protein kinase PknB [Posidoniimonas polymericola]